MAELSANTKTSFGYEDVIVGAMQFFCAEDWRATEQTARTVVLRGRPRIPWYLLLLMTLGFLAFVIPVLPSICSTSERPTGSPASSSRPPQSGAAQTS